MIPFVWHHPGFSTSCLHITGVFCIAVYITVYITSMTPLVYITAGISTRCLHITGVYSTAVYVTVVYITPVCGTKCPHRYCPGHQMYLKLPPTIPCVYVNAVHVTLVWGTPGL